MKPRGAVGRSVEVRGLSLSRAGGMVLVVVLMAVNVAVVVVVVRRV